MPSFFYGSLPPSLQKSYINDPRQLYVDALTREGTSQAPLRGGATEGALRIAAALLGGYQRNKLAQEYQTTSDAYNKTLADALASVKPGHFDPTTKTYIPTDTSGYQQALQTGGPLFAPALQDLEKARIGAGLDTDTAVARAQATQAFKDPIITNVNGRVFKDGVDTGITIPRQYDPEEAARSAEDVRHDKAMEEIGRLNASNKPPPIIVGADGILRYATGPVAGEQAPPKGTPLADKIALKQAPTGKDLQGVKDAGAMYDKALQQLTQVETLDKGLGALDSGPLGGHNAYSAAGQNYDLAIKSLAQSLVGALRVPGEALRTNLEQQAILGQTPSRTTLQSARQAQYKRLRDTITQLRDERSGGVAAPAGNAPNTIDFNDLPP